ncbi:MAG: hypothetical protein ACK45B_04795 [Limisphaerales bacterium]|jgi:hypothetical protein
MSKVFEVLINGEPVGSMSQMEIDMPWFYARFSPNASFAKYAALFGNLDQAYDEKRYDDVNRLNNEINKLRILIPDENKQVLFSTDQNDKPIQRIRSVRILGNKIMWRPAPGN